MLRIFEAFAGYGSQSIALRNLGVEHEVVAISEIDKYALKAYYALHDESIPNLGDISKIKIEDVPEHDLFTYSFPCQDISVAGKQKGIIKGETRSGLLYECERIIEGCRPKYLLLENVKNLAGKKHKPHFDKWLEYLEGLGYTNYWQVLNAKNYGVPQNRERVFVLSILGKHEPYEFPTPIPLTTRVKDLLEDEVEDKYYLSEKVQERFKQQYLDDGTRNVIGTTAPDFRTIGQRDLVYGRNAETIGSLVATDYKQPKQIIEPQLEMAGMLDIKGKEVQLPAICASRGRKPQNPTSRVAGLPTEQHIEVNTHGVSNTLTTVQKDNYVICEERCDEGLRFFKDNICGTVRTKESGGDKRILSLQEFRIRKLTPRECFRLMGLKDSDIDKIQATGLSNSQQYKMAGNSIVVNVLEGIFKNLF